MKKLWKKIVRRFGPRRATPDDGSRKIRPESSHDFVGLEEEQRKPGQPFVTEWKAREDEEPTP